jgi:hypothetical protein
MDEQQEDIDALHDQITALKKELEKKNYKAKMLGVEDIVLEEQLQFLRKHIQLKEEEIKIRKEKLTEIKEGGETSTNFMERERRRRDFDFQMSNLLPKFIEKHEGFTHCKVGYANTIKVTYLKGAKDGELACLDNAILKEAKFRINSTTTLADLKDATCRFWDIGQPETMALRETNLALVDLYQHKKVQKLLYKKLLSDELTLFEINREAHFCFSQQENCFAEQGAGRRVFTRRTVESKQDLPHSDEDLQIMYRGLENAYKGLHSFRAPKHEEVTAFKSQRSQRRDSSMVVTAGIILLLIFSLACVLLRRDVSRDFWIQAGIHSQLLQNYQGDSNFFDINTVDDLTDFITSVIGPLFFVRDVLSLTEPFNSQFMIVGPIRFRQQRVKYTNCPQSDYNLEGKPCIEPFYNSDTAETDTIKGGNWDYTDASENDIHSTVRDS